jgi:tRNA(fMet)-specific endonuclease VapC
MPVSIEVLPFETPGDFHYGGIRHDLARHGTPIGPNDLLIAAHARSLDLTVVTANDREFSRIPDLQVENWMTD